MVSRTDPSAPPCSNHAEMRMNRAGVGRAVGADARSPALLAGVGPDVHIEREVRNAWQGSAKGRALGFS
jgi:hypothetical protein